MTKKTNKEVHQLLCKQLNNVSLSERINIVSCI
jgi:hypothetical protein